jgi:hypothetical protein
MGHKQIPMNKQQHQNPERARVTTILNEMCLHIGSYLVVWYLVFGTWNFSIKLGFVFWSAMQNGGLGFTPPGGASW